MKKKSKNIKDIKSYIERYMNEDKNLCKFEIECTMLLLLTTRKI